jgi:hypothetical protein
MQIPHRTGRWDCQSVTLGSLFVQHHYTYNSVPDPGSQKSGNRKPVFLFKNASGMTNPLSARKGVFQVNDGGSEPPGNNCR